LYRLNVKFSTKTILTLGVSENFTEYFVKDMRLTGVNGETIPWRDITCGLPCLYPRIGINQLITK